MQCCCSRRKCKIQSQKCTEVDFFFSFFLPCPSNKTKHTFANVRQQNYKLPSVPSNMQLRFLLPVHWETTCNYRGLSQQVCKRSGAWIQCRRVRAAVSSRTGFEESLSD